ncbi:MAG: hypothetical protein H5U40_10245 [Polyangiaceae bacterium]|nr:hypothetical protein [Polyangiaceae bacterium]
MEQALRDSGAASWVNPAWLLLRACRGALSYVSRGARRLQEIRADRWAAELYGGRALASALRQAVGARARFEAHAFATVDEVVATSRGLSNIYTYRTRRPPDESRIKKIIESRWNQADRGDERSSPAARVARLSGIELELSALPSRGEVNTHAAHDDIPAWALFSAREALETSMTESLRNDLARKGVHVTDGDDTDSHDVRAAAVGE